MYFLILKIMLHIRKYKIKVLYIDYSCNELNESTAIERGNYQEISYSTRGGPKELSYFNYRNKIEYVVYLISRKYSYVS